MTLPSKTRLGKRRLEMQELRKEKQTTTSKKHDKNCLDKGYSQELEELRRKFKDLQERHDIVINENTKHVEKIKQLEIKVKTLESEMEIYESPDLSDEELNELAKEHRGGYSTWAGALLHIADKSRPDI